MIDRDPAHLVRRGRLERREAERRRRHLLLGLGLLVVAAVGTIAMVFDRDPVDEVSASRAAPDIPPASAAPASAAPPTTAPPTTAPPTTAPPTTAPDDALPPSGDGRRVVFSIERQRMWWVDHDGSVLRTALVSGREATPATGTFQVFSKSLNATGLDGSRMDYFVRFTHGPNGWAIGFHDIPRIDGVAVQSDEELGQPLSAGCIRQSTDDAVYTWEFLDVGDTVVVVA